MKIEVPLPSTKKGWIILCSGGALALTLLYFVTDVFKGHAVEVSVDNVGQTEIFASIDNTGRHGENTNVVRLNTVNGGLTPSGLRIKSGVSRSFGMAVGFFDSPTVHIWEITETGLADGSQVYDCVFDTVQYHKLQIPTLHIKLKWTGHACERSDLAQ